VLSNKIVEVFLGVPKRDWSADYQARTKQNETATREANKKIDESRVPNTRPSFPLSAYVGRYGGQLYGDATISEESGHLVLRFGASPNFVGDLDHWHFDTFSVKWRDSIVYPFGRGFVSFVVDASGKVSEMKLDVPNPDFDFKELEFKREEARQ
jgi:hypothetical protein